MPVVRGDAVVRSIRRERPGIRALYISGFAEELPDDNTPDLLLKPFDFPELGRRIRSILEFDLKHQKLA
jgi:DNA-binding response OmpR family regulator